MPQSLTARGSRGGVYNAFFDVAASQTDFELVAARPGKKIRVLAYTINQGDTTPSTVRFNSKAVAVAGTAIWPTLKYAANGGVHAPETDPGYFETNKDEALTVNTGAGSTTGIAVTYDLAG